MENLSDASIASALADAPPHGMFFTKTFRHDTYPFISPSLVNMSGKTVLITGASRGIGFALAASYAKAGVSNIVLAARSSLEDTKAAVLKAAKVAGRPEPSLLLLKLDVSDPESVLETARQVQQKFSTVDVLVNNAGYMEPLGFVGDSNPENWWKAYEVNLRGPYLMIKAFLPIMVENEGDRQIVNVGSVGALWVIPSLSGYPTAKLALMRLTEVLDAEFASQGVLTFSLHPGGIRTDLALGLPEKLHQYLIDTLELPVDSIVWMTSQRREWLAGRYVSVNWDMEELEQMREAIVEKDLLKNKLQV